MMKRPRFSWACAVSGTETRSPATMTNSLLYIDICPFCSSAMSTARATTAATRDARFYAASRTVARCIGSDRRLARLLNTGDPPEWRRRKSPHAQHAFAVQQRDVKHLTAVAGRRAGVAFKVLRRQHAVVASRRCTSRHVAIAGEPTERQRADGAGQRGAEPGVRLKAW